MGLRSAVMIAVTVVLGLGAPAAASAGPPPTGSPPLDVLTDQGNVDLNPPRLGFYVITSPSESFLGPNVAGANGVVLVTAQGGRPRDLGTVLWNEDQQDSQDFYVEPCDIGGRDLPDAAFTVTVEFLGGDAGPYRYDEELRLGPDQTDPKVKKIQSSPPPESKVEKGDTIRFEVVGREDLPGETWQTGVQTLQVTGPDGLIKDKSAGRTPKACGNKSESLTIQDKYKVRGGDPAVIEICGIAQDYAANEDSNCAKYYKGEVWEGPFRQKIRGCTGVDEWTLQVVVAKDGSVTGNGTLTSPGILCPDSALAPAGLTLQISGNRDRNGFHLTVVPCSCPPLDLGVAKNTAKGSAQDPPPVGSTYTVALTCKSCED